MPDIVSFNMYSGWYKDVSIEETNERELDWIQKSGGNGKPVIVSEFGVWQFADCRVTEEEWFSTRARCHNNKGVVDEYRRPKFAFDTVKEMFQSK